MKIDIEKIAENCINNLDLDDVDIDDVYNEAYEAVDEIIGNIAIEIISILKTRNIEVKQ